MPLQPAGDAVTFVLADPVPLLFEKESVVWQALFELLDIAESNEGEKL
jgi:hypothetical protein